MSSNSIPDELLLKIFDRLPFKDRVRLRGVNRLFRDTSNRSINRMRLLEINDDIMRYTTRSQSFSSLLQSCSPILESIIVNGRLFTNSMLYWGGLTQFVYPKLKHLEITVSNDDLLAKEMISRNRNLRSIILRLKSIFKWPEDVPLQELEILEIHSHEDCCSDVDLSQTLRPLIGNVPNLKQLTIKMESKEALFILSVQEFNLLLIQSPYLETLNLQSSRRFESPTGGPFDNMCVDLVGALRIWFLPKLKRLTIDWYKNSTFPSSITTFPMLESFSSNMITNIDDQGILALAQLGNLRELRLPRLEMTNDKFTEMIGSLPPISVMQIGGEKIVGESLNVLFYLDNLHALYLSCRDMSEDEIIDLIQNVPSLLILGIRKIRGMSSAEKFIEFLTTTRHVFQRNLTLRLADMSIRADSFEMNQLKAITMDMKDTGGSIVIMRDNRVLSIRFVKFSDG